MAFLTLTVLAANSGDKALVALLAALTSALAAHYLPDGLGVPVAAVVAVGAGPLLARRLGSQSPAGVPGEGAGK